MSDLLRVTTPVAPKDYNLNTSIKPQAPEQVFDLGNVDYINKTNTRDEQLGEQNLKDQQVRVCLSSRLLYQRIRPLRLCC